MGPVSSGSRSSILNKILMTIFTGLACIGVWFFVTHWDRPVTNATILSAIMVELPIQFYFQKIKK